MKESIQKITIEDMHKDIQPVARLFVNLPMYRYWFLRLLRFITRLGLFKTPCLPGVSYSDTSLVNAKVRVYSRDKNSECAALKPGVLWIHGGGLITGAAAQDNKICSRYVNELDAVVCSVEYRLAPENPFPAGLDDCFEAWQWFLQQAEELGVDPSCIMVAGQSGGGCMAASLAQHIYDAGGVQPKAQLLFCPMLDDRTGAKRELDHMGYVGWTNRCNRQAWSWYMGCEAGADQVPENSVPARRADLSGLPPAWIGIGDLDLFYDEAKIYAERLQQAGVETTFDLVKGGPHGFEIPADGTPLVNDYFTRHFQSVRRLAGLDAGAAQAT